MSYIKTIVADNDTYLLQYILLMKRTNLINSSTINQLKIEFFLYCIIKKYLMISLYGKT